MIFDWYQPFNKAEFIALGLVSNTYNFILEDVGEESILVTQGNMLGVSFRDVYLPIEFNDDNPTIREGEDESYAVYLDADDNVWIGIEVPEA